MKCPIDPFTLSMALDGEIGVLRGMRIRRHLARCDRCRAAAESLGRADEAMRLADWALCDGATPDVDAIPVRGEDLAAAMPGRQRLAEVERSFAERRRRRGALLVAVVIVTGGAIWWVSDPPARADRALYRMGDENRRVGQEMLERARRLERKLVTMETQLLAGDLDDEARAAGKALIDPLREELTRARAAARHASGGVANAQEATP